MYLLHQDHQSDGTASYGAHQDAGCIGVACNVGRYDCLARGLVWLANAKIGRSKSVVVSLPIYFSLPIHTSSLLNKIALASHDAWIDLYIYVARRIVCKLRQLPAYGAWGLAYLSLLSRCWHSKLPSGFGSTELELAI